MSAPRCSDGSAAAGEQLAGSAPAALGWVALEQNGPWGARAFTQSHLPVDVGRGIEERAAAHRLRPALVRRPGRHADDPRSAAPRTVLVAHSVVERTWLLEGAVEDPAALLDLDWAALAAGDADAVRRSLPGSVRSERSHLLVCTNGTRDLCCAAKGRPLALGVADALPDQVWEVTHTGGHRFAPTAALVPAGTLHGRLDVPAATAVLLASERGETVLAGHRGRTSLEPAAQVADLHVRALADERGLDALRVAVVTSAGEHTWECDVRHRDGRRWRVEVSSVPTDAERSESCGKSMAALRRWRARLIG